MGGVNNSEMFRTFNMGVGMVMVVEASKVEQAMENNQDLFIMGEIVEGEGVSFS